MRAKIKREDEGKGRAEKMLEVVYANVRQVLRSWRWTAPVTSRPPQVNCQQSGSE